MRKNNPSKNREKTNLMVDPNIWKKVKAISMAKNQSVSDFVMEVVDQNIKDNKIKYRDEINRYYRNLQNGTQKLFNETSKKNK
ncbi:MAG: hypothetical protein Q7S27_00795 [Nanoarchaeota archaeon]|nr:hypothetical protein [Nanoarchaeota archaeon]